MSAFLIWDRLRPDPVDGNTTEALRCEIRDPLWMLARQYQMRELVGSDAGSVSVAHAVTQVSPIARWATDGGVVAPVPPEVPLDPLVERVAAPFDLQLRLETGREWLRMLRDANKRAAVTAFQRDRSLLVARVEPSLAPDDPKVTALASDEYARMLDAVAGRMLDGEALFRALANRAASSFLSGADPEVDALGVGWRAWVQTLVGDAATWTPSRLAYRFRLSATGAVGEPRCLATTDHDGRGIDWTSFDHVACPPALAPAPAVVEEHHHAFVPSRVRFVGMPAARWWEFEAAQVDLGSLQTPTTDTGALLLAQFALLYSTDWLAISLPVARGSLAQIAQLDVTDVFGVTSTLPDIHATASPQFRMFRVHGEAALDALVVPHAPGRRIQSSAIEEVQLVRDEIANLAWAIEARVSNGVADSIDGKSSALALEAQLRAAAGVGALERPLQQNSAHLAYKLATDVPPHAIPFMPIAGDQGLVLRRAAIPRMIEGQPITRIRSRTQLVRSPPRYELDATALPPSGVTVRGVWRRTRSSDGRTHTWFAYERMPAARAAAIGLVFDQIVGRTPGDRE